MKSYIDLGKLILLTTYKQQTSRNELARPVMGTIFLVYNNNNNIYIRDSQLNRPESVSLASLASQLYYWRASEASETHSIATYRKKCLGLSMSKPQCACSQFYVKRRSGRAGIYEKFVCC